MLSKISNNITEYLVATEKTSEDNKELVAYGIEVGLAMLLNIVSTLLVGLIFSCVIECIVFLIAYIPIRSFAGGYHASNHFRCYLISITTIMVISILLSAVPLSIMSSVSIILSSLSILVIVILSPVQDRNKPLDDEEVVRYRKMSILFLIGSVFWVVGMLLFHMKSIALIISLSLFLLSIMLILGYFKNKIA